MLSAWHLWMQIDGLNTDSEYSLEGIKPKGGCGDSEVSYMDTMYGTEMKQSQNLFSSGVS